MAFRSWAVLSVLLLAVSSASARPAPPSLPARLQSEGNARCWDSLVELRSCSGEVILFFLNGETYLGPSCCRAVGVVERDCWAADVVLAAMGFTPEEGDILRGYCDNDDDHDDHESSGSSPALLPPPSATPTVKKLVH